MTVSPGCHGVASDSQDLVELEIVGGKETLTPPEARVSGFDHRTPTQNQEISGVLYKVVR